jgi:hypothetical protein
VALLRPPPDAWSVADWQAFFDERVGIAEFDGGLSRGDAEAHAFAHCVAEWLNRNPVRSLPERCLGSDGGYHLDPPLTLEGHVWPQSSAAERVEACAHARTHLPRSK